MEHVRPESWNAEELRRSEEARNDPRLERRRGSMIADFNLALEEAERMRELTT